MKHKDFICPYCGKFSSTKSRDHIFPDFLGGRRKILCCGGPKNCNNIFGHTFEAGASKYLLNLHVFISSWGIPLRSVSPVWRAAITREGKTFDLEVDKTGVKPILSASVPHIKWDGDGQISERKFRTRAEAEKFANHLIKKGKATKCEILYDPPKPIDITGIEIVLKLDNDIKRMALKMCLAVSSLLPDFTYESVSLARNLLTGERRTGLIDLVLPAYDNFFFIDSVRQPLSHLIYVHRIAGQLYGVVQFFGVVQFYCKIGEDETNACDAAFLGTLDPVNGKEDFSAASQIEIVEPPSSFPIQIYPYKVQQWLDKFRAEAIARSASHPPDLKIASIQIEK